MTTIADQPMPDRGRSPLPAARNAWAILIVMLMLCGCVDSDSAPDRLGLIKDYMRRGDLGTASLELANLIQSHPDNLEARMLQGKVSIASGRAAAAELQLATARELGAPESEVLFYLGKAVMAQGEYARVAHVLGPLPRDADTAIAWNIINGHTALYKGDLSAAAEYFETAHSGAPDHLGATLGLARVAMASGDLAAAEKLLSETTGKYPLSIAAWQTTGALRILQSRYIDAERAFINAIEGSDSIEYAEEYMLARVGLIEAQWLLDKKSLAKQNNKDLILNYPWHPLPRYLRGLLAFYDQEYESANDQLQHVIAVLPQHLPSLKLLAAMNSLRGNLGQAQMYLDRYVVVSSDDPEILRLMSSTYMKMGNAMQAVEILKPLIANVGADAELFDLYGTANLYAGEPAIGLAYLQMAVGVEPQNIRRQTRLAAALLNQGNIAAADELMKGWQTQNITENSRKVLRLERFLRSQQTNRASEYAKKLRRENPSDLHSLLALAELAEFAGNRDGAIDWLEIARDRNKTAVEPRILLATLYLQSGDWEKAREVAQEAAASHPYNASVLGLLAQAHLALRDFSAAQATASEAVRLAPSMDANHVIHIRTQLANGDLRNAQNAARALAMRNPAALPALGKVIVEEFQRGNKTQAFDLARHLVQNMPGSSQPYEISGDLHFLSDALDEAHSAYLEAMVRGPSRIVALKATVVALGTGRETSTLALRDWLESNPEDQTVQTILQQLRAYE